MKTEDHFKLDTDGCVHLVGELTFDSTPGIYQELESRFQAGGEITSIDLSEVDRIDSSGLAMVLEWQAMVNRHQGRLQIINAPVNFLRLAKLCEADKLLETISTSNAANDI